MDGKTPSIVAAVALVSALALTAPAVHANPPDWAPAHGWRPNRERHDDDRDRASARWQHKRHDDDNRAPVRWHQEQEPSRTVAVGNIGILNGNCNQGVVGSLLGTAAGAALGAQFGRGNGRVAAAVIGAVLGYLTGSSIGESMGRADRYCFRSVMAQAPEGHAVAWRDSSTGNRYRVTPRSIVHTSTGRECREYTMQALIAGHQQQTHGRACRQPDGTWQIVNRNAP